MPFNTTSWVYSPAVGATNAAPGQLIQSAIWDGIFTDLSGALNQLGALNVNPQIFQTAGATTYVASTNLVFAVVEAMGGGGVGLGELPKITLGACVVVGAVLGAVALTPPVLVGNRDCRLLVLTRGCETTRPYWST